MLRILDSSSLESNDPSGVDGEIVVDENVVLWLYDEGTWVAL